MLIRQFRIQNIAAYCSTLQPGHRCPLPGPGSFWGENGGRRMGWREAGCFPTSAVPNPGSPQLSIGCGSPTFIQFEARPARSLQYGPARIPSLGINDNISMDEHSKRHAAMQLQLYGEEGDRRPSPRFPFCAMYKKARSTDTAWHDTLVYRPVSLDYSVNKLSLLLSVQEYTTETLRQ